MKHRAISERLRSALEHHAAGRLDAADALYRSILAEAPHHFDAVHLSGTVAVQQGRWTEALDLLGRARRLQPKHALCAMRLGLAYLGSARLAEAQEHLEASVRLDAALPESYFHLGFVYWRRGNLDAAAGSYRDAIVRRPEYAEAYDRLGALLTGTRGHAAAEPYFRKAVAFQPNLATGWCNLGVCLMYGGQLSEALLCFERALSIDPRLVQAHTARGIVLERCYDIPAALRSYEAALAVDPANTEARSASLVALQYLGADGDALAVAHREYGAALAARTAGGSARRFSFPPDPERKLRIGILSPDLHRHSVAYFLEPLLAHLDRRRFEVFAYHDSARTDEMSEQLRRHCDAWRPVAGQPDDGVEAAIRADAPHILVDLAGHTGLNRLALFARRLAPVQATYLGYPDTTGVAEMDYRLVDEITDPAGDADRLCTERLLRFAPTAWAYAPPSGAPQPQARTQGAGGVVFGCFNNFAKASDATLALWRQVLAAVPDSRLTLKATGLTAPVLAAAVRRRLTTAGVDPLRVDLLDRTQTMEDHLASYGRVDVALDTYPYHGTTTTCEALWMGVPVVSLRGDRHASRVGASLLTAIGHPEWIAATEADYVRIATDLANRIETVRQGRSALRVAMLASPLLDHAGQAARFGAALREMWRAWCARQEALAA